MREPSPIAAAYTSSENHKLGDITLLPFTPQREVAARSMGLIYPFIGRDGVEQLRKNGTYPGMVKDVIVFFWLCTIKAEDSSYDVDSAERSPREAYRKALAWAEPQRLYAVESDEFRKASNLFLTIMDQIRDSKTTPVTSSDQSTDTEFPNV